MSLSQKVHQGTSGCEFIVVYAKDECEFAQSWPKTDANKPEKTTKIDEISIIEISQSLKQICAKSVSAKEKVQKRSGMV